MIKLKDILKESKVSHLITEKFKSNILRKFSAKQNWGLDRDLYTWMAKQGVMASEIQDKHINKLNKLPRKGVAIAVTSKKVTLYAKGNRYWESDQEIDKGTIVSVLNNGKTIWWTKSYYAKDISVGNPTKWGADNYKTFGLNKYGYQSPQSIKKIDGIQFYQILTDELLPYIGADVLRKLRSDVKDGSWTWRTDKDFKQENERRYEAALKKIYNDPAKVKSVIKKTKDYANKLIVGLVGGKPNAFSDKIMAGKKLDPTDEGDVMSALASITTAMNKFYEKIDSYRMDLERDMRDKKNFPDNEYMGFNAQRVGKEIGKMSNTITSGAFARIW
tara:strand:- start:945 stop:1937 length:993 start_codon:yes stop_codon:yes gene_type:complete